MEHLLNIQNENELLDSSVLTTADDYKSLIDHLKNQIRNASLMNDQNQQVIHDLKRSNDINTLLKQDLQQEVELLQTDCKKSVLTINLLTQELNTLKSKQQPVNEFEDELHQNSELINNLNRKVFVLTESNEKLERDISILNLRNMELESNLEKKDHQLEHIETTLHSELSQKDNILLKLEEVRKNCNDLLAIREVEKNKNAEYVKQIKHLEEQLAFSKNTPTPILEPTPTTENQKGNSVFAELDDKRRQNESLVRELKKANREMKGTYNIKCQQLNQLIVKNNELTNRLNTVEEEIIPTINEFQTRFDSGFAEINRKINEFKNDAEHRKIVFNNIDDANRLLKSAEKMLESCRSEVESLQIQLMEKGTENLLLMDSLNKAKIANVKLGNDCAKLRSELAKINPPDNLK